MRTSTTVHHPAGPPLSSPVVTTPGLCQEDIWVQIPAPVSAGHETLATLLTLRPSSFLLCKMEMILSSNIPCDDYSKTPIRVNGMWQFYDKEYWSSLSERIKIFNIWECTGSNQFRLEAGHKPLVQPYQGIAAGSHDPQHYYPLPGTKVSTWHVLIHYLI